MKHVGSLASPNLPLDSRIAVPMAVLMSFISGTSILAACLAVLAGFALASRMLLQAAIVIAILLCTLLGVGWESMHKAEQSPWLSGIVIVLCALINTKSASSRHQGSWSLVGSALLLVALTVIRI